MIGDLQAIVRSAASLCRLALMHIHQRSAGRWPHGLVAGVPAANGEDLRRISLWTRIPWPSAGVALYGGSGGILSPGAPLPDHLFREALKDPFGYHRSAGREDGIANAMAVLGYPGATQLDYTKLTGGPTWTPPGATMPVPNHNAFGVQCPTFPGEWTLADGEPTYGTAMYAIVTAIRRHKRASAKLCEVRKAPKEVVTQSWWDAGQVPATRNVVRTETSTALDPNIVTTRV